MHHPTHGFMFGKHEESQSGGKSLFGDVEEDSDLDEKEKRVMMRMRS